MSTPYVGQIILVGFNFAPIGYFPCDGRLLSISDFSVLFDLIGTTYGGDGQTTFALPDLRGRVPVGMGTGSGLSTYVIGQTAGNEAVTLSLTQIPSHVHAVDTSQVTASIACKNGGGNAQSPVGNVPAGEAAGVTLPYSSQAPDASMGAPLSAAASGQTALTGGNQPHDNMQPYLVMQYCIAVEGIFPSQT
jgi:microcystin-dependent protein